MSCQRCSIGLSQFRLLQNVPGTSARRKELCRQGVTGNGPKIVHRQPPEQRDPLVSSQVDNLEKAQKSRIKLAQYGPLVPQRVVHIANIDLSSKEAYLRNF